MGFLASGPALAGVQAGASVLGGVSSFLQAGQAADFKEEQFLAIKENALASFATQAAMSRSRTVQERAQIAEEIRNLTQEGLRRRGAVSASAGANEVAGRGVAEAQLDFYRAESGQRARLDVLQRFRESAAEQELAAMALQTKGRIQAGVPTPTQFPSLLGIGLDAVGAGIEGFAAGQTLADAFGPGDSAFGGGSSSGGFSGGGHPLAIPFID